MFGLSKTVSDSLPLEDLTSLASGLSSGAVRLLLRMLSDMRLPSDRKFEIPFLMESANDEGRRACCLMGG